MKKCIDCGKKGLFLKLSSSGRCFSCESNYKEKVRMEAAENARRIERERLLAEQERKRIQFEEEQKKKYSSLPHYSRLTGGWYLVYSYTKVPINTDENAYYHGDVNFLVNDNSVEVYLDGSIVGVVSHKGKAQMIIDFINRNEKVLARFDSPGTLRIAFYKKLLEQLKECESSIFKITSTSKRDEFTETPRYENLDFMDENDLVKIEYNDDTEKISFAERCRR